MYIFYNFCILPITLSKIILKGYFNFTDIYITIRGISKCSWSENKIEHVGLTESQSHEVVFSHTELHLNKKIYLFGHEGAIDTHFSAGSHIYNFECDLPEFLPYTFSGSLGNITYKVEAFLVCNPIIWTKQFVVPFTVHRFDNLNTYASLRNWQKLTVKELETTCCFPYSGSFCFMTITIPFSGYAAGGSIPIEISYKNESSAEIDLTKISLYRVVKFNSSVPIAKTKAERETVAETSAEGVDKRSEKKIECVLALPRILLNSNSRFSKVVQISYYLEVEGASFYFNSNPRVEMPVIIGNVAFDGDDDQVPPVEPNELSSAPAYEDVVDANDLREFKKQFCFNLIK